MATKPLEATVRQEGHTAIISLRGEIDSFGEATLNTAYDAAEAMGTGAVLLNFSGVDYMNSTGIALIVALLARARKTGRRLLTSGLSTHYVEIFKITRLADFMSLYPDEATALAQGTG
jgi:anti-sigma B factor antagonist